MSPLSFAHAIHAAWLRAGALAAGLSIVPLLNGCAPTAIPMGPPVRPAALAEDAALMPDGTDLPLKIWWPEASSPRAVILALHGFNDYSNAFAIPAPLWAEEGIATYAYDQRGFGASEERGLWPSEEALGHDLRTVLKLVRARHPGVPLYVLGESMGAAVAIAALAGHDGLADGAVLVAPAVRALDEHNPIGRALLWLAAHTVPWWSASGKGLDIKASDNIEVLRALARDPLVVHATRADSLYGLIELMDAATRAGPRLALPLLILHGEKDELVPMSSVRELAAALPNGSRFALYPNGYHLLLRDLQAELVIRDVAAWLIAPQAPLPSRADTAPAELAQSR